MSDRMFFGVLAYVAFYWLTLIVAIYLIGKLVIRKAQRRPHYVLFGWVIFICLAGLLREYTWFQENPTVAENATYWRHWVVIGIGVGVELLFFLDDYLAKRK